MHTMGITLRLILVNPPNTNMKHGSSHVSVAVSSCQLHRCECHERRERLAVRSSVRPSACGPARPRAGGAVRRDGEAGGGRWAAPLKWRS